MRVVIWQTTFWANGNRVISTVNAKLFHAIKLWQTCLVALELQVYLRSPEVRFQYTICLARVDETKLNIQGGIFGFALQSFWTAEKAVKKSLSAVINSKLK